MRLVTLSLAMFAAAGCTVDGSSGAGAGSVNRCDAAPSGEAVAFLQAESLFGATSFDATVVAIESRDRGPLLRLRDVSGRERSLVFLSPRPIRVLKEGQRYSFTVEYVGGWPDVSALQIREGEELLFASATAQWPMRRVLHDGLPGFTIELLAPHCGSRRSDRCYEAIRNAQLRIGRQGEYVELYHGESGTLGEFDVFSLTAQHVDYRERCADAGLPAVSFIIEARP